MTSKIKIKLHLKLLQLLTSLTGKSVDTISKTPQQHFVKLMMDKLHQKFYQKLIQKRFNQTSAKIDMTIKFEEAYALDIFLANTEIEMEVQPLLYNFIINLNKAIQ